jgi:hypothetical protein
MRARVASLGVIVSALAASGCVGVTDSSYELDSGAATYDGLKAASDQCGAKGGKIHLRKEYGGQNLSDYECVIGRAR